MAPDLHVLFGAGQVGYPLAARLLTEGHRVLVAKRSPGHVPPGADVVLGDAADEAFCLLAARGAVTVYHCMNPPYDSRIWADLVPRYMNNVIAASAAAGARLVVLDNIYMLGAPRGRALNEDTAMAPRSRKGEIRARAAERLFDAHRRGEVVATAGRASDFYGPGGTLTGLGDFFWPRALAGKTAYLPFSLDAVHTYHYIPDVAAGLAVLGTADASAYGTPWMLPCAPAGTMRELITGLSGQLGRQLPAAQMPRWGLKLAGVVSRVMRELDEMAYQWDEPFIVDDRRFRARFGSRTTGAEQAAADTVKWAQAHYGTQKS